jgi:hypothetical protein
MPVPYEGFFIAWEMGVPKIAGKGYGDEARIGNVVR